MALKLHFAYKTQTSVTQLMNTHAVSINTFFQLVVQLSPWIKKTIWHIWQISPGIKKPFKPIWLLLLVFISGYNNEYKIKKNTNQNCSSLLNSCCYLLGYFSSITGKNCQCSHLYSWSVKLSSSKLSGTRVS